MLSQKHVAVDADIDDDGDSVSSHGHENNELCSVVGLKTAVMHTIYPNVCESSRLTLDFMATASIAKVYQYPALFAAVCDYIESEYSAAHHNSNSDVCKITSVLACNITSIPLATDLALTKKWKLLLANTILDDDHNIMLLVDMIHSPASSTKSEEQHGRALEQWGQWGSEVIPSRISGTTVDDVLKLIARVYAMGSKIVQLVLVLDRDMGEYYAINCKYPEIRIMPVFNMLDFCTIACQKNLISQFTYEQCVSTSESTLKRLD
jgi:hypothetical protein